MRLFTSDEWRVVDMVNGMIAFQSKRDSTISLATQAKYVDRDKGYVYFISIKSGELCVEFSFATKRRLDAHSISLDATTMLKQASCG